MKVTLSGVLMEEQAKALAFSTDVLGFVKKLDLPAGEYPAERVTPSLRRSCNVLCWHGARATWSHSDASRSFPAARPSRRRHGVAPR